MTQTLILSDDSRRMQARRLVDLAPHGSVLTIKPPSRSLDQNAKLWAVLSEISRAKPEGRMMTPEDWKAVFMNACGWECQFQEGLDGRPFPLGFRSSKLSKEQMSNLLEFIHEYAARHNIILREAA